MQINRILQNNIAKDFYKGKVLVVYGARQVGKTTLVQNLLKDHSGQYYLCEERDVSDALNQGTSTALKSFFGNTNLVVLDEAQTVLDIGKKLKLLADNFPQLQIVVTGSSSFEISNLTKEPLTGRKFEYLLYPISILELLKHQSSIETKRLLSRYLEFGMYPEILYLSDFEAKRRLQELSSSYLFRDVFNFQQFKNPEVLDKLLKLLAFQIGSEVSFGKLSNQLNVSIETIERYINLLEQAFIIFRLSAFSRNKRNEITKTRKIYFYDLGIRNSLIQNFNPVDLRPDIGGLWENFLIVERRKYLEYNQIFVNSYFWRNYNQQEIDYIEEKDGILNCFEFKWSDKKKAKLPSAFESEYPNHTFKLVNQDNWLEFVTGEF
jgi:predicted AAA+ superfamily ATPase